MGLLNTQKFKPAVREINVLIAKIGKARGMSHLDEALILADGTSENQIKRHIERDSSNTLIISKLCKLHHLAFWDPDPIANGKIWDIIDNEFQARDWTLKVAAQKMYKKAPICEWPQFLNRFYKCRDDRSTNGFWLALIREIIGKPTVSCFYFLNERDLDELSKKAQLELGI